VTALTVGRQTGGDLPKVLETTASVMRETMRVEGMMAAKTSEGKMQGLVMSALPFLFGIMLEKFDPDWMFPLFHDPYGWAVLTLAMGLWFIGVMMVRKVSRIDV
jgi:tight adherence protein B